MIENRKEIVTVMFWCVLLGAYVDCKLVIHMKKVEIVNNPRVANATASIRRYGPSQKNYVVDFGIKTLQSFSNAMVTTIYYVPNLVGKYEKAFYNRTINFCTYLRQPLTDRVLNIVYENLNQRGNLPKRCPVLSASYTFNTSFDDMNLPGFLPESSFRFDLNFKRGPPTNELIFNSYWYGDLRRMSS